MKLYPLRLPESVIQAQCRINELLTERTNSIMRTNSMAREAAVRRAFLKHGWRKWLSVCETQELGKPLEWLVIRQRPQGLWDWIRHKAWALRTQMAIWRSN